MMMMMTTMMMILIRLKALIFCTGKDGTETNHSVLTPLYHLPSLCFWKFILEDKQKKKQQGS